MKVETMSVDELSSLINLIHDLIRDKNLAMIDKLLEGPNSLSSPLYSIVLLRSSFTVRDKLDNWKPLVQNATNWFMNRELDSKSILVGLL